MTTLGNKVVAITKHNLIRLHVSGDLSYSYVVVPIEQPLSVGLAFVTIRRAMKFAISTGEKGWKQQVKIYQENVNVYNEGVSEEQSAKFRGGRLFEFLPEDMAIEYLPHAYGEYAEEMRKKLGIKQPV